MASKTSQPLSPERTKPPDSGSGSPGLSSPAGATMSASGAARPVLAATSTAGATATSSASASSSAASSPVKPDRFTELYNQTMAAEQMLRQAMEARRQRQKQNEQRLEELNVAKANFLSSVGTGASTAGTSTATTQRTASSSQPQASSASGSTAVISSSTASAQAPSTTSSSGRPRLSNSSENPTLALIRQRRQEMEAKRKAELEAIQNAILKVESQLAAKNAQKSQPQPPPLQPQSSLQLQLQLQMPPGSEILASAQLRPTNSTSQQEQPQHQRRASLRNNRGSTSGMNGAISARRSSITASSTEDSALRSSPQPSPPSVASTTHLRRMSNAGSSLSARSSRGSLSLTPSSSLINTGAATIYQPRRPSVISMAQSKATSSALATPSPPGPSPSADEDLMALEAILQEETAKEANIDLELRRAELRIRALERAAAARAQKKQKRKQQQQQLAAERPAAAAAGTD